MKYLLLLIVLSSVVLTNAKPIFTGSLDTKVAPEEIKDYFLAYLKGFEFYKYFNSTAECSNQSTMFLNYIASSAQNYVSHKYFEGSLDLSDALGKLSPITRVCESPVIQLMDTFYIYLSQFKGIIDYFIQATLNAMSNVKPIQRDMKLIINEVWGTKNYTYVSELAGEITSLVLAFQDDESVWSLSNNLKFTEADPFAPDPLNHYIWVFFEGLYKFGVNSKLADVDSITDCQEGFLNMAVLDGQAIMYWLNGDAKNAWTAIADSLTFGHQIVDSCYKTYSQGSITIKKVKEQIIDTGKFKQNILNNLFFVVSNTFASWSQLWYGDFIFLLSTTGNIVYNVFVYGIN